MKVKEKSLILCVLECICQTALLYPILTLLWYLFIDRKCISFLVLCTVAVSEMILYYIRRRVRNSLLFIALSAVYLLVLFVLGYYLHDFIYIYIGTVMAVFCLTAGFSGRYIDLERPNGGFAGLIIFAGVCVWLTDTPELLTVFYICEAVYVVALVVYNNLERTNKFIWENRRTAFLYVSQIKYANYLITAVLVFLILIASVICSLIFTPVLNLTREPMLNMIKSFMNYDLEMTDFGGFAGGGGGGEPGNSVFQPGDSGASALRIILYIIGVALLVFFIIVFIVFIIKIIKNLSMSSRDGDIKEYILPSDREDNFESIDKAVREKANDKPAIAIRKMYKRKIKSSVKKGGSVNKASTPNEQMAMAGLKGESADVFAELYRKARYSNIECSEQDVEKMKSVRRK